MSEQRVDPAAEAATGPDADPGEGAGLAPAGAHPTTVAGSGMGTTGDLPVPGDDERRDADEFVEGETEGERSVRAAQAARDEEAGQ